ncbi:MAG: nucleotide exchange factor GrpE [Tepidiformaceae bacterium]
MQENEDERIVDKRAASRMHGDDARGQEAAAQAGGTAAQAGGTAPPAEESTIESQAKQENSSDASADLAAAREQADAYYKNWQRSAADFINFKRRVEQDRAESARMASAALVINLLPVYDDLDRAVGTVDAHLAGLTWVQGVIAIQKKFSSLLEAMNVTEVAADGQPFDPERHEAVGQQPGPAGKVLYVVQKGYQFGDRLIRPAMVIVGDGSDANA